LVVSPGPAILAGTDASTDAQGLVHMNLKVFGITLAAVALAACSSRPTEPTARAPARAPAPSSATAPASAVAPASATPAAAVVPAANGQPPVLNRTLIAAGYKATSIRGETYYCRSEIVTGTSFKKNVCLNEAQLKDEERKIKEMQDKMIQTQANPACTGNCGG
jgi:hypothetical protein